MNNLRRHIWILLCIAAQCCIAQNLVYLEHSDMLSFDEKRLPDVQILSGDVRFRHDSALMYCDSAYFYEASNSLDAFGHVRFVQGDTLTGTCQVCYYDGNTKLARMQGHVVLRHRATTLTTDSLNYNRVEDRAYYYTGGTIRDSLNTLRSVYGQYHPPTKQADFRRDVLLENPHFTLRSQTLHYNTESKVAELTSPTTIVYEEETTICSSKGWYNTDSEESLLLDRSTVTHTDGKTMTGDSIFYNKKDGWGRILGNMVLVDSTQKSTLYGNVGLMYERKGERLSHGYATDSALLHDWSDEEHNLYVHADTLFTRQVAYTYVDSAQVEQDSTYRLVRAYHHARIFRDDLQAVADSMIYNELDSLMKVFGAPICWHDTTQMSADSIFCYLKDKKLDYIHGMGNAIVIKQEEDTAYFNQIAGKELLAYVRDSTLERVEINGNAESIFYPKDENDGSYIGLNRTESSYIKVFFEKGEVHHMLFTAATSGTLYPLDQIPVGREKLGNFFWAASKRPLRPGDVFEEHPQHADAPQPEEPADENIQEESITTF